MTPLMRITDLTLKTNEMEQAAELLVEGFRDAGSAAWRDTSDAREEVRESLRPGRISRIAIDEHDRVVGWIGGIEEYAGNVWELHPLVVRRDSQRQGIGRRLVADLERLVAARGAHTIRLGADDENGRTSLGSVDLYPDVLEKLRSIRNLRSTPSSST